MLLLLQPFFKMHLHLIHKIKMSVWVTWPSRMAKFSGSHGFVRTRASLNTRHDLRLCREIDGVGGLLVNFFPDPDRIQFRVRVDNLDLIIRLGSSVFEGWLGRGRWPSRKEKKTLNVKVGYSLTSKAQTTTLTWANIQPKEIYRNLNSNEILKYLKF